MKDNIIVIGNWIFIKIDELWESEQFVPTESKYVACGRHGGVNLKHIYTKSELLAKYPNAILLDGINPTNTLNFDDK